MYYIGIDSGSVATKGVLFNGEVVKKVIVPTGWSPKNASLEVFNQLKDGIDDNDIKYIIGTGYGRVSMDFVDKAVTEITCHGKGIFYKNNNVRTILDIGGQDSKAIKLDDKGNVVDFLMNDKCAAGTGRFLQVIVNTLGEEIENIDQLAGGANAVQISSMCTVFAESEVVSLLANGHSKSDITLGIINSIINRGSTLLDRVGCGNEVAFTGGLAKSKIIVEQLSKKISAPVFSTDDSQFIGAIGAAVIGYEKVNRSK